MLISSLGIDLDIYKIGDTIQMAGAVYNGEGRTILCLFPGEKVEKVEVMEMTSDEWKTFIRQTDLLETEIIEHSKDGTTTKAIVRKSQRQIDTVVQWKVFRRDGYTCRYCGADDVPLTVDHLVTWETGGPTVEENLLTCCKADNKTRGRLSYAEWLEHPYYKKVSARLTEVERERNRKLLDTLPGIPRIQSKRSR